MTSQTLPFRQIHLDFHTSEHIPSVGEDFNASDFAGTLADAHVTSVVLFAKCHHGWSYYDSEVGARHPSLQFDLLGAQVDACEKAGIETPIYISVGWDERAAREHVDWRQVKPTGEFYTLLGTHVEAAWKYMCIGGPYLEELAAQVVEVLRIFPNAPSLWLDIIRQEECVCVHCQAGMVARGMDWTDAGNRQTYLALLQKQYYERIREAADSVRPNVGLFHNTSMVPRGDRALYEHFSHVEIESVPTGGWGYDHLPMSAKYAGLLGKEVLGVTVRFHIVWGELGGYKHPAALEYELGTMLTHGAKVCIGDQLDPSGRLDGSTYRMVGNAFHKIKQVEQWTEGTANVADIGILSSAGERAPGMVSRAERHCPEDEGAHRILAEGHFLYDVIDRFVDFANYGLIILPDRVRIDAELADRLKHYLAQGGKVLQTGESGLTTDGGGYAMDIGADLHGPSPFNPSYFLPIQEFQPDWVSDSFSVMSPGMRLALTDGTSMGDVYDPLFNRTPLHFNGHIHAPPAKEPSGYLCGVEKGGLMTVPFGIFSLYRQLGAVTVKAFVTRIIEHALADKKALAVDGLPSAAVVTMRQRPDGTRIMQMVYAAPQLKGETVLGPVETVEELIPVGPVTVELADPVSSATLQPSGESLKLTSSSRFTIPRFEGHCVVTIE